MQIKFNKYDFLDILKTTLLSVVFSILMVMLFAIIAKFTNIGQDIIEPINIAIKILAVALACIVGIKHCRQGLLKGIITGTLYALATYLIFCAIQGDFSSNPMSLYDFIASILAGTISSVLAVNIKSKNA